MNRDSLAERGKGLEDAFFANQDAILKQRLAERDSVASHRAAMAEVSGITDPAALDHLTALGLSAATLAAITLVPLVAVAWADGSIEPQEREVLLAGARQAGLDEAHPGYALFESWLVTKPKPDLVATWKTYVAALPGEARSTLRFQIVERAKAVAEAAGGFLGVGRKVSGAEQAVLDEVMRALAA